MKQFCFSFIFDKLYIHKYKIQVFHYKRVKQERDEFKEKLEIVMFIGDNIDVNMKIL